jgi:SAM-dependent methyltransferase
MNHVDPFPIEQLYQGSSGSDQYFKNVGAENNVYVAMRHMMSYVKSQLISEYGNNKHKVLDLASGRGQDLHKYIRLNSIGTVVCTDNDKAALTELFSRWLDISRKAGRVINSSLRGLLMDVNDPADTNIEKIVSIVDSTYFNTIFCHQALHYFLESTASIHNLAKLCSKLTIPGSHVVMTCPFGEAIFNKIGNNQNWTCIEDDVIKYKFERMYKEKTLLPAGQKIKVLLPFSMGELYEEYLVNTSTLEDIFSEYNLRLMFKKSMSEYLDGFSIHRKQTYDKLTDGDRQDISLYGVLVFKKA